MNPFSPPQQPGSAMSNPHGPYNPFSPISIPANGTPGPLMQSPIGASANPFSFAHISRQSVSLTGTPANVEWDPYAIYTPPITQQHSTSSLMGGSGVWSPVPPFAMRNASPMMPMHGHSPSQFGIGYPPMHNPMDPYAPHHGLVGQERFMDQQIRRGSPLAQPREPMQPLHQHQMSMVPQHPLQQYQQPDPMQYTGPSIDAPVPKHRHQISVSLQNEYDNSAGYQEERQVARDQEAEGYSTNQATAVYPDAPEMPSIEADVHNSAELASNPDEDVDNIEEEKQRNIQESQRREEVLENGYAQEKPLPQEFMPQTQYAHPHSREHSHQYDMMMGAERRVERNLDELLSEDGRTNLSDNGTNPYSEPSSPRRTFNHVHQLSNQSNVWTSEHTKSAPSSAPSTTKPKLNPKAGEFKFDPTASFNFTPKSNRFSPTSAPFTPGSSTFTPTIAPFVPGSQANTQNHSRDNSDSTGFGGFGAGFNNGTFRPSLSSATTFAPLFQKGAAAFSPDAPVFTPSFAKANPAPPPVSSIFSEISKSAPVKVSIPIVRSESRADDGEDIRREGTPKRVKQEPVFGQHDEEDDIPALNDLPAPTAEATVKEEVEEPVETEDQISEEGSDDSGEELMKEPLEAFPAFEFRNQLEAEEFANASPMNGTHSRQDTKVDVLDDNLSPEEAFHAAASPPLLTTKTFNFSPDVPEFSLKNTQDFNFEFPKPVSPPRKFAGLSSGGSTGMGESRYAHTPSPPPSIPAPHPPIHADGSTFLPPRAATPYADELEPAKETAPMPTDAELDEVIKYMDRVENQTEMSFPERPSEDEDVDDSSSELSDGNLDDEDLVNDRDAEFYLDQWKRDRHTSGIRSAGPSPPPRRPVPHRPHSFSPDEPQLPHAISHGGEIGIAKDAESDWDDMISEDGGRLRPQSRLFFDAHVESLVDGLIMRRLQPLHSALEILPSSIVELLGTVTEFGSVMSPRERRQSDADDEEDGMEIAPPKDRKLEKIKSALVDVLTAHFSGAAISEQSMQEIKDAVLANADSRDLVELKSAVSQILNTAARKEDVAVVRATLEDVSRRVARSNELADLKAAVTHSMHQTARIQEDLIRQSAQDQSEQLLHTAKVSDVAVAKDAIRDDIKYVQEIIRNATDDIMTNIGDRVDETKFVLSDAGSRQRTDISEARNAIMSALQPLQQLQQLNQLNDLQKSTSAIQNSVQHAARKEDLMPIHNVLAESFERTAKTEEILELKRIVMEIMSMTVGMDVQPTYQEVLRVKTEQERNSSVLHEMLRIVQDHAANMDFHQEQAAETVKDGQAVMTTRIQDVYSAVREVTQFIQNRASKADMRRNLFEKEQKQDSVMIKEAIKESNNQIQRKVDEVIKAQPTMEDFRTALLDMKNMYPGIEEFKEAFEQVVETIPGFDDIKRAVGEVVIKTDNGIDEYKKLVEEDRERKVEAFRAVVEQSTKAPSLQEIRHVLEDVVAQQQLMVSSDAEPSEVVRIQMEKSQREAEHFRKVSEEEQKRAREWQEKVVELEMKLKLAEEEKNKVKEEAEEQKRRMKATDEKRMQQLTAAQMRTALLEGSQSTLQKINGELTQKNAALEAAMVQTNASEEKHRAWNTQLETENKELRKAIDMLKSEMEEDMRRVSLEIGAEQGKWRKAADEQAARIQVLEAKLAAETAKSQGWENEVRRLEQDQKDAIRLRIEVEQFDKANARSEEIIRELRNETMENQNKISQLVYELDNARDLAKEEAQKVRYNLHDDVAAANAEVAAVKEQLRKEIELANTEKEKMEQLFTEIQEEHAKALEDVTRSKQTALSDLQRKYERQLDDEKAAHTRALRIATEDAERSEYFNKNLKLHIETLQTQVTGLTENLKIVNTAARFVTTSAVRDIQSNKQTESKSIDERALKETVHVLQSQLQERESRIETLSTELSTLTFDRQQLKQTEGQLNMYRELLDLRIDDLEEIIHTCNLPHLDRGSLQDAATRLRASLQMHRDERERAMGITTEPEAEGFAAYIPASVTKNLPQLPGVASAAWNTFKNRGKAVAESTGSPTKTGATTPTPTPSRPSSSASNFLNSILTPPTSSAPARRFTIGRQEQPQRPRGTSASSAATHTYTPTRQSEKMPQRSQATNALLFRNPQHHHQHQQQQYNEDSDSKDGSVLSEGFYDEDNDDALNVGDERADLDAFGTSLGFGGMNGMNGMGMGLGPYRGRE
ncbi:hypothetical protein BZA77DRAFT_299829 [Pyronema omphalodes]|nr:hypothetical protein BZA77DRAFT_299829 [Pyronema omphalodes]